MAIILIMEHAIYVIKPSTIVLLAFPLQCVLHAKVTLTYQVDLAHKYKVWQLQVMKTLSLLRNTSLTHN
jgi:hypothetical protein